MRINFPAGEHWFGDRMIVSFQADVSGRLVRCAISMEALEDHWGATLATAIESFRLHRTAIEAKAQQLLLKARFEGDGSILIRTRDMP